MAGTAQAGTVASAIRFIAKAVMTGTSVEINRRSLETIRGQISSDKGQRCGGYAAEELLTGFSVSNGSHGQRRITQPSNISLTGSCYFQDSTGYAFLNDWRRVLRQLRQRELEGLTHRCGLLRLECNVGEVREIRHLGTPQ
jgi:hypothetical protein